MRKVLGLLLLFASQILVAQPTLELFPGLETAGINVYLDPLSDSEGDVLGDINYRLSGASTWNVGFPMTNVPEKNRLSTSMFWLQPATIYEVQVVLSDPTTPALNVTLSGSFMTRAEIDFTLGISTLYVSPDGTGNACTTGQPCSLPTALLLVEAGQDIEMMGGNYHIGGLNLTKSGTTNAPITIRSKSGEAAILDGSDPEPYIWLPSQGNPGVFYTNLKDANANVNCVVIDDLRMYPYAKPSPDLLHLELSCILGFPVPIGISGMNRDPRPSTLIPFQFPNPLYKKLFVHLADGSDPNNHEVAVSLQRTCLSIENQSFIRFQNLTFRHYGVAPLRQTIALKNCNEIVFDHCNFEHNDININVQGNTNRLTVQHCFFRDDTDWNTFIGKATYEPITPFLCYQQNPDPFPFGERIAESGAIFFDFDYTGRGAAIRGNTFTGFMDGTHASPAPNSVTDLSYTQECDVFDNLIDGGDDGIELEGLAGNLRFFRNILRDCGAAASLAPVRYGPVFLLRNIFSDFHTTLFTFTGSPNLEFAPGTPMKFQSGFGTKIGKVYAFHNTVCVKGSGWAYGLEVFPAGSEMDGLVAKNNIFFAEKNMALLLRVGDQLPKLDLDFNNYVCADTLVQIHLNSGLQHYFSLPDFSMAYGLETHGLNVDPEFVDTSINNFQLKEASPCIDAGLVIAGINDRWFQGNAPDLGALETTVTNVLPLPNYEPVIIYPNPAKDYVKVEIFMRKPQMVYIEVLDGLGRRLKTLESAFSEGNNLLELPLNQWDAGIYHIGVHHDNGVFYGHFVKTASAQ